MNLLNIVSPRLDSLFLIFIVLFFTVSVLHGVSKSKNQISVIRIFSVSSRLNKKLVRLNLVTLLIILVFMAFGVMFGDFPVPKVKALSTALWDRDSEFNFVINSIRSPRVVVAVLAGMCLASSGAIFQSLINNPLVSPDVIGVNSGAAVCAVILLAAGGQVTYLPFAAFIGAILAAMAVYILSWKRGIAGTRLVLIGIGINALLAAVITFVQVRYPIERVMAAARWQAGTVFGATWDDVRILGIGFLILFPAAFFLLSRLRILQLGDETAIALGSSVERDRLLLLTTGASLAAIAVAVVGPLGFVALMVPQAARLLTGSITGGSYIFTALLGGIFLLGADLIALHLFAPVMLPVGVVTAALGGPYFLILLARYNRAI
tara:strand:- start:2616 stop:3746 length:1131 start_codon:yes stop_codon:yes gene_type:complete